MDTPNVWCLRQNPAANTDQAQMRDFILEKKFIISPWGEGGVEHYETNRVIEFDYNEEHPSWKSRSQDRTFMENIKINDYVLIPFAERKECILARILSNPIYNNNTGLFIITVDGKMQISNKGETQFGKVGREIEIISDDVKFDDKRCLSMSTLKLLKNKKVWDVVNTYLKYQNMNYV